jgi:hypothetical protein
MPKYNTLAWQNETGLTGYPFSEDLDIQNFIVDAKFTQFDGFLPRLTSVEITLSTITIRIAADFGGEASASINKIDFNSISSTRMVRVYTPQSQPYRCLGVITFGGGVHELWEKYPGRTLVYDKTFLPSVVRSIPLNDAVYLLDGSYGETIMSKADQDTTIFFNSSTTLNSLTFNAVGGSMVDPSAKANGLRKINLVKPKNNNINLASNDVIKIGSLNNAAVTIDLVAGKPGRSFIVPSLTS